ncbi:MAG: hypothetical protein SPE48_01660 [Treponema porcinum]|uniref:hypothetical protein n=1 Tax=Treponema porcinum TaxID=261392 RepID=UPI002356D48C|nr:hypothetical protein [Treponema porcinum]MCI6482415.1 hypothetical protein [Treponema porcinum]MDY5120598.1 hypothetical protein [Treponema porcinum]
MNKILKILSIFVMVFVLFSCANPSSDSTSGSQPSGSKTPVETPTDDTEPSGPETPVETPSDDSVEETPEEPTYSITFTTAKPNHKIITDYLNSLPEFKNLKEGTEVKLYKHIYLNEACTEITTEIVETSVYDYHFNYDTNNPEVSLEYDSNSESYSVVIGKEDVEVEVIYEDWSKLE